MSGDLLQTKLHLPQLRPYLISRPHLIEKLNKGLSGKLTLVAAPAGFGKTTLVAEWLSQFILPNSKYPIDKCAWLSLDEYDDDPNRFWQYVFAAMETAVPNIGTTNQQLLQAIPLPQPPALLTGLINGLADLSHSIALVLDDYHFIGNRTIHQGLNFLLEHAPAQLHSILITRADPPLSLPRFRALGLLNEIRADDLRFSEEESAVLLRQVMRLPISARDVASLNARTEGWIAGLQLAAVSLQGLANPGDFIRNFSGGHHFILEYLAEEVLLQQLESVQTFLLQTSILHRLCGSLCDAVTGRDDSQIILEQLYRENLFITPLDDGRQWYRYHQLFADLLGNRLRQVIPIEEIRVLHHRASGWCEENGDWETAVFHAVESSDWERTASLVARAYTALSSQGRIANWQRWLAKIPTQLVRTRPELFVRQGWSAFLNGQVKQAEVTLQAARKMLLASPVSADYSALRGELATYLATIAFFHGQPTAIIQAAEEALAYLPPEELNSRVRATIALGLGIGLAGDSRQALALYQKAAVLARTSDHVFLLAHALETVADGQRHMGQLRAAAATCQEITALGSNDRPAPLPFAGNGHIKLAAIYTERHELSQAKEHLDHGLALSQQGGIGYILFEAYCIQAKLRRAAGDEQGALVSLDRAEVFLRDNQFAVLAIQLVASQVQHWLDVGDVVTAAAWAKRNPLTGEPIRLEELPVAAQELQQVTLARVRLAQGRPDAALAIYDQIHDRAETAGRMTCVIEIGLVQALALQAKGKTTAALDTLRNLLVLTRPEGYVQIFVGLGQTMQTLLSQLPENEKDEYVTGLIHAFPDPSLPASTAPPPNLVEPLSPREVEVLRLIAAGLSNKQIASELTVTLDTIKKHSSHIYGKLGVNSRTQAIARAHRLNLL